MANIIRTAANSKRMEKARLRMYYPETKFPYVHWTMSRSDRLREWAMYQKNSAGYVTEDTILNKPYLKFIDKEQYMRPVWRDVDNYVAEDVDVGTIRFLTDASIEAVADFYEFFVLSILKNKACGIKLDGMNRVMSVKNNKLMYADYDDISTMFFEYFEKYAWILFRLRDDADGGNYSQEICNEVFKEANKDYDIMGIKVSKGQMVLNPYISHSQVYIRNPVSYDLFAEEHNALGIDKESIEQSLHLLESMAYPEEWIDLVDPIGAVDRAKGERYTGNIISMANYRKAKMINGY